MRRKKRSSWYRSPKTTAESRAYYANTEYVRAKRRPANIPNDWWDLHACIQKTWKVKREKQYRGRSQLNEYNVNLTIEASTWALREYFEKHDIPYRLEDIKETRSYTRRKQRKVKDRYIPVWHYILTIKDGKFVKKKHHQIGWKWTYKWIKGQRETYQYAVTTGYKLTYWHRKELNLDFIYYN